MGENSCASNPLIRLNPSVYISIETEGRVNGIKRSHKAAEGESRLGKVEMGVHMSGIGTVQEVRCRKRRENLLVVKPYGSQHLASITC